MLESVTLSKKYYCGDCFEVFTSFSMDIKGVDAVSSYFGSVAFGIL